MAKQLTEQEQIEADKLYLKYPSASRSVWSYPMLQALENGVKGGKWFSLKDKIHDIKTLLISFNAVAKNKGSCGIDNQTIEMFESNMWENLGNLQQKLANNEYEPIPVKRVYIDKPGSKDKRPLGIPAVSQRVVENAIKQLIEPIFEKDFLECSYGFRPNRGAKGALEVVTKNLAEGYIHIIDADIKGYFDSINHALLMTFVEMRIADGWVLNILKKFLSNDIMDGVKRWTPEMGSPQGSVISPLLSNIYLHRLDTRMIQEGFRIIRYADDFVVMCKSAQEAEKGLAIVKEVMDMLMLKLHPEKTKIVEVKGDNGFEFLGYLFTENRRRPKDKSIKSLRMKIRDKTSRNCGTSLEETIESLNATLRGWYGYFKHIKNASWVFKATDQMIRRRLRSILAKFEKKRGSHRMLDNFKISNDFFHKQGLFSLLEAHNKNVILERGKL